MKARVHHGLTLLIVPYKGEELNFIYPGIGLGNYDFVRAEVSERSKIMPTFEELSYLVHTAYNDGDIKDKIEFQSVRTRMQQNWLWPSTRTLWEKEGVYVYDDRLGVERNKKYLDRKLSIGDKHVRYIEHGFQLGDHTPEELETNPYVIALVGVKGAQKLTEIINNFKRRTHVYGLKDVEHSIQKVTAINHNVESDRLNILGDFNKMQSGGTTFGLLSLPPKHI